MPRRIEIYLRRHPEKVAGTGELTVSGLQEFFTYLMKKAAEDADQILVYLTPHEKRGKPLARIVEAVRLLYPRVHRPRLCRELFGRFSEFTQADRDALDKAILKHKKKKPLVKGADLYEPRSSEEERIMVSAVIQRYWDRPMAGPTGLTGREIGAEIQKFVDGVIALSGNFASNSTTSVIAISHSGIIEHFTKLVYLANNPHLDPQQVSADDLGGLVPFLDGPILSVTEEEDGTQFVSFNYKKLNLVYTPAGPGRMTLSTP